MFFLWSGIPSSTAPGEQTCYTPNSLLVYQLPRRSGTSHISWFKSHVGLNFQLNFMFYRSYHNFSPLGWELTDKSYCPCNINGANGKIYEYLCDIGRYNVQHVTVRRCSIEYVMNVLCENLVKIGNEKFIEVRGPRDSVISFFFLHTNIIFRVE